MVEKPPMVPEVDAESSYLAEEEKKTAASIGSTAEEQVYRIISAAIKLNEKAVLPTNKCGLHNKQDMTLSSEKKIM